MHECELRGEPLVAEIGVERFQLQRGDHALVDQGPRRQRWEVCAQLAFGALAQAEGLAVELDADKRRARDTGPRGLDEQLLERRCSVTGQLTQVIRGGRHLAPAENPQALVPGDGGDAVFERCTRLWIERQERHADRVASDRRQLEADDGAQELVGDLRDDAGAVARAGIRAHGAPVLEVTQRIECHSDDVVAGRSAKGRDHGQAAGVLLAARVVEALCRGQRTEPAEGVRYRSRMRHEYRPHDGAGDGTSMAQRVKGCRAWCRWTLGVVDRPACGEIILLARARPD